MRYAVSSELRPAPEPGQETRSQDLNRNNWELGRLVCLSVCCIRDARQDRVRVFFLFESFFE